MIHESIATKPRARRRAAKHEAILEAAMDLIVEGGLESCSIHRVARAVDYTPGALYRYFDSKEALLSALVVRVLGDLETRLRAVGPDPAGPSRVVELCRVYRLFSTEEPQRFSLLAVMMARSLPVFGEEDRARPAMAAMLAALAPLIEALEECVRDGVLEEGLAHERALVLFGGLQGILQLRKQSALDPDRIDLDAIFRSLVVSLLRGWGAAAEAIDRAIESSTGRTSR